MIREPIKRIAFKNVLLSSGNRRILESCNFEFPLNCNTRIICSDDREKYGFLNGLVQLSGFESGQYLFNRYDAISATFEQFLKYRLNLGYGFANRGLLHNRTLRQNLLLPILYHNIFTEEVAQERVEMLFDYFEVGKERDHRPADVSSSTMKVTLLLRAFVHQPEWVILDSPEVLLSHRLYANLLQFVEEQRQQGFLKHFYFSTEEEALANCLSENSLIVNRCRIKLVEYSEGSLRRML